MALLEKPKLYPSQRLDLEDWNLLLTAICTDSQLFTKQFWAPTAFILKGFEVSGLGGPSPALITLDGSTLINPENTGCFSWFVGASGASPLEATLTPNARNYLELELGTETGTPLTRAFWDPSALGGLGSEFNQTVDTTELVNVSVVVSTGGFSGSTNRIPLAIVDTDVSNNIELILDKRDMFFRSGSPSNPEATYSWASQTEPETALTLTGVSGTFTAGEALTIGSVNAECSTGGTTNIGAILFDSDSFGVGDTVTGVDSGATGTLSTAYQSFSGADKSIDNIRELLFALQTEIKRLKGTRFWFESGYGSLLGTNRFINSLLAPYTSDAKVSWSGTALSVTDSNGTPADADIIAKIRIFASGQELDLTRQDGSGGSSTIAIADGEVLYVEIPASGDVAYSGSGAGATNYKVVARDSFVLNDNNYWLAYREGSKLIFRGAGELQSGESSEISDNVPSSLLASIGLSDEVSAPSYTSDIRGTANESIVSRVSALTDDIGDSQEDRSTYLKCDDLVSWTGTQLEFTEDIVLEIINTKSGTLTQHTILAANSPIALSDLESVYISIDRTQASENVSPVLSGTTPIPAQTEANKDIFVLFRRVDNPLTGLKELYSPFLKQFYVEGQVFRIGASGSGSGTIKADYLDPISTTLPTGATVTIDGQAGVDGDQVLFSNLSSGNNKIYELSGVGVSISWDPVKAFLNGSEDPFDGDSVRILKGDAFADQLAVFNGTNWLVNDVVRYFDGVSADFWEQSSIKTADILDNTTDDIFTVAVSGSENFIIGYSVVRGLAKETGQLIITSDGTDASLARYNSYLTDIGVEFFADISGSDIRLRYTADSSGSDGTIKYFVQRWSNSPGGPSGIPSYSGGGGGATPAAGSIGEVQFHGSSGNLDADPDFKWDTTENAIDLNGLKIKSLSATLTILDNQASATTLFSLDKTTYPYVIIEYSVLRNTDARTGRIMIASNGTVVGFSDDSVESASTGITFSVIIVGSNIEIQYTSTNTGNDADFKYTLRGWN